MAQEDVLQVEGLKKYFTVRKSLTEMVSSRKRRYVRAVDDVSFTLEKQKILGLVGESGCGKSTLSRTILRLVEPTDGKVYFQGNEITLLDKARFKKLRRRMQMIFQDPFGSLNPRRSVSNTVRQSIKIHKLANNKAREDALISHSLEEVGLKPVDEYWEKYPALLSGGQLQRVCIGRVHVLQPHLIIADEPISMLDVSVRIGILDLLAKMRDNFGVSFIYITHDLVTARYICDRIAIMYLGRIVEIGETETVLHHPVHPYTKALIAAVPDPDPTLAIEALPIKGYVPVNTDETIGCCNFAPRCPYAEPHCRAEKPAMADIGEDHRVACFFTKS